MTDESTPRTGATSQPPDRDPDETAEWFASVDAVAARHGPEGCP